MKAKQSITNQFSIEKMNSRTYSIGFLKFEKEKKGDPYYFSGFNRYALTEYLTYELGYYRIAQDKSYIVVKHDTGIVEEVPIHQAKNELLEVLKQIVEEIKEDKGVRIIIHPNDILEKYHNVQSTYFSPGSIDILKELNLEFLRDDSRNSYFFFKNGVVKTSAENLELLPYEEIGNKLIWKTWIKDHEISLGEDTQSSMFEDFISNVSGDESSIAGFVSAIGYLLVNYNWSSKNQAIILYDEKITDLSNPSGGTGKGLFAKALSQVRKQDVIDGKKFNTQSSFAFQNVTPDSQIIFIDDVKSSLDFKFFYSILTEGLTVEQKNKTSWKFDSKNSPKMIISSNAVFSNKGNSNRRRQFILEFSDFYSSRIHTGIEEPVRDHHGCMFFEDWDNQEWNRFYVFLMNCTRQYLKNGLIPVELKGLNENLLLQQTSEDFYEWVHKQNFIVEKTYTRDDYLRPFKEEYFGESREFSPQKFNTWMKAFADSNGWEYKSNRSNSINYFLFGEIRENGSSKINETDEIPF